MVLDWCLNFVSAQYFENKSMESDQILHMHLYWEDEWDYYMSTLFLQILNRLGTLDWCQNLVSAQNHENYWMDFNQILHMHLYSLALGLINIFYTQYLDKY